MDQGMSWGSIRGEEPDAFIKPFTNIRAIKLGKFHFRDTGGIKVVSGRRLLRGLGGGGEGCRGVRISLRCK